jgi:hypothetical protein
MPSRVGRRLRRWADAQRARLKVELLESRCLPSTFTPGGVKLTPLVQVSSTSPFLGNNNDNIPGQFGTVFLNSEVEPSLAVDPTNPKHLVGVWQQDRWSTGGARGIVTGVSYDGGNTWSLTAVPGISQVTGGPLPRASDPWVSFAPNGDVYVSSLAAVNVFSPSQTVYINKSTDGGKSWGPPTAIISDTDPNFFDDKESVTADPTNSQFAYCVWDRITFDPNTFTTTQPVFFSRTTNGGQSWEAPRDIFDGVPNSGTVGNIIAVLPNGTLVDIFEYSDFNTGITTIDAMRSIDHGATWSAPVAANSDEAFGVFDPNTFQFVRTGSGLPAVAVDPRNGNLYTVWEDARFTGLDTVAFSMSKDGGLTWSTPIKISKTPASVPFFEQQAFTPEIAVAANGNVAVTYYDFRNPDSQSSGLPTDAWMIFARGNQDLTNPANWGNEQRLTTSSFDMDLAPNAFGLFVGDYQGLAAGGMNANSFSALFGATVSIPDPASMFFRDPAVDDGAAKLPNSVSEGQPGLATQAAGLGRTESLDGLTPSSVSEPMFRLAASTGWEAEVADGFLALGSTSIATPEPWHANRTGVRLLNDGTMDALFAKDLLDEWSALS